MSMGEGKEIVMRWKVVRGRDDRSPETIFPTGCWRKCDEMKAILIGGEGKAGGGGGR